MDESSNGERKLIPSLSAPSWFFRVQKFRELEDVIRCNVWPIKTLFGKDFGRMQAEVRCHGIFGV